MEQFVSLGAFCSVIRGFDKEIGLYESLRPRYTQNIEENSLMYKLILEMDREVSLYSFKRVECALFFEGIMTEFNYYGKNMTKDIFDKIYSFDDIISIKKNSHIPEIVSMGEDGDTCRSRYLENRVV